MASTTYIALIDLFNTQWFLHRTHIPSHFDHLSFRLCNDILFAPRICIPEDLESIPLLIRN